MMFGNGGENEGDVWGSKNEDVGVFIRGGL
jgi:hypothetical protein